MLGQELLHTSNSINQSTALKPFSSRFLLPLFARFSSCNTCATFSMSLPTVESLLLSKCPVLLPYPAPAVDPLPILVALLYGAVLPVELKWKVSAEEGKADRLLPVVELVNEAKIVI